MHPITSRLTRGFSAFFALSVLGLCGATGATVVWQSAATVSADTDVLNTGTIVQALNFGVSGSAITVNGVSFTNIQSPAYGVTMGSGAGSVTLGDASYQDNGGLASYNVFGSGAAPFSSLSSNYKALLQSAVYRETGTTSNLLFTLNNLEIGGNYRVQFWTNDARGATGRTTTYSAVSGVTLDQNTTDTNGGLGQFATGFFTADSSSQNFLLTTTAGSTSLVSAYTLATVAIPEPSAYAALAGAIALVATSMRRHRQTRV